MKDKDPKLVAEAINRVVADDELRKCMSDNEQERLKYFSNERIQNEFMNILNQFIAGE